MSKWVETSFALPMNPVGSRSVAREMGFSSSYECDALGRRVEFQSRLIQAKTEWESEHSIFVTDRTTLDNLAYSLLHGAAGVSSEYLELACRGLRRYEYVVYCPVSVFIDTHDDPARMSDMTYHLLYDATLWGLLQRFRPPEVRLVTMPFAKLEHREDFLRSLVKP